MPRKREFALPLAVLMSAACFDDGHDDHEHGETEFISTVELTFTPDNGGAAVTAAFTDPDGDGGVSGMADPITLEAGIQYSLDVRFLNETSEPVEDITEEIRAEAEEHFVFFGGDAPVMHAYADLESDYGEEVQGDDLPLGLFNQVSVAADAQGSGTFRVVLRHLPELNGVAQKAADLPQLFDQGDALPGDVDADVQFELTVN
jgi:hypothetical protein